MRIAAFADVHGNWWAMEAVFEAIRRERPDLVVFLGDAILRVPAPRETMERLRAFNHQPVRGNYDWFVIGGFPGEEERLRREPFLIDEVAWTRQQLSADDLAYLEAMPIDRRLFPGEPQELLACHASPGKAFGGIFPPPEAHPFGMSDEACLALLEGETAPTLLCGHTHAAMDRQIGPYRVINPGSVSLGWNERDEMDGYARWALLDWDGRRWRVSFRREGYDHRRVWEAYRNWPLWPQTRRYEKPRWWGERARRFALGAEAAAQGEQK